MDSHCSPPRQNSRNCWTENSAPRWKTVVPAVVATCKQPCRRYCLLYTRVQPHVVDQSLDALANLLVLTNLLMDSFINQLNRQSTPLLRLTHKCQISQNTSTPAELGCISFCIVASLFVMRGCECATNASRTAPGLTMHCAEHPSISLSLLFLCVWPKCLE